MVTIGLTVPSATLRFSRAVRVSDNSVVWVNQDLLTLELNHLIVL